MIPILLWASGIALCFVAVVYVVAATHPRIARAIARFGKWEDGC